MKNDDDINFNKILKSIQTVFSVMGEFSAYCKNITDNITISSDYELLLGEVMHYYFCATNTAKNFFEIKSLILESLLKFDENLFEILNDVYKIIVISNKTKNLVYFIHFLENQFDEEEDDYIHTEILELKEYCYLYLFLDIADDLPKIIELSKYSFHPEESYRISDKNYDLKLSLAKLVINYYNSKSEYIDNIIIKYFENIGSISPESDKYKSEPEIQKVNNQSLYYNDLEKDLKTKIIGQNDAISQITRRLKTVEYGINKKSGAKAVYMLLGPTGVGKTETVKIISDLLRNNHPLIRIDMGEYKEAHMASKILGSPPGYIGHSSKNNVLEIIKNNPHSFILIDEIEKAHPDVVDLFLHMFDEGKAKDSQQNTVDLSNNVFFITSNIGVEEMTKNTVGFSTNKESNQKSYEKSLKKHFRPEFINRINEIVIFKPLNYESAYEIINLQINEIESAFLEQKDLKLKILLTDDAYKFLISEMDFNSYGAREIKRMVENYLLNNIIDYVISNDANDIVLEFDIRDLNFVMNPVISKNFKKELEYKNSVHIQ